MNKLDELIDELITDGKLKLHFCRLKISNKYYLDKTDNGIWEVLISMRTGSDDSRFCNELTHCMLLSKGVSSQLTMLHTALTKGENEAQSNLLAKEIRNSLKVGG